MDEKKQLNQILLERLEQQGLTADKAIQITGIPKHYFESMLCGKWTKLPAAPYVRGYLKKLESVLETDNNYLWETYKEEMDPKTSGAKDKLPENRYAIKSRHFRWIWPAAIVIILGIYGVFNAPRFLGLPKLEVTNPFEASVVSQSQIFFIEGKVDPNDKLFINGEEMFVDKTGHFSENYNLQPGVNIFELTARKFLGKEVKITKQIVYQPER